MTRKHSIPFEKWPVSVSPVFTSILKYSELLSTTLGNRICLQPANRKQVLSGCLSGSYQELYTQVCTLLWKTVFFQFAQGLWAARTLRVVSRASLPHCQIAPASCWPGVSSSSSESFSSRISQGLCQSLTCHAEESPGCHRLPRKKQPACS